MPVEIDQLGGVFTRRPNGWPAPLTVLKAGSPVGAYVEGREQSSGRGGEVKKEQLAKDIVEEIISKVFEAGRKGEATCGFLAELDLQGDGWKEMAEEVLHSQDGGSAIVS